MPIYTIISEVADDMHATQHEVNRPCNAICDHIASRGLDPLFEFSDDQVTQLQRFFGEAENVKLLDMPGLSNTWLWSSNIEFPDFPQPITAYVVKTDASANK